MTPFISMYLDTGLELMSCMSPSQKEMMRVYMPYCLHPIPGLDQYFILLNRDYKPCGIGKNLLNYAIYETFEQMHINKDHVDIDSCEEVIGYRGVRSQYFYNDSTNPFRRRKGQSAYSKSLFLEYEKKLNKVFRLIPIDY